MRRVAALLLLVLVSGVVTRAYVLNIDGSGNVRRWNFNNPPVSPSVFNPVTHAIRYYVGADGWSTTNTAAELNAVRASFGQWQAIPNTVIKYEDAGLMGPGYDVNPSDETNVVYWSHSVLVNGGFDNISGLLGRTYFSTFADGTIAEFDIVLNGANKGWFTDFNNNDPNNTNFFAEGTLLHEIGHSLGLNHASIGGATLLFAGQRGVDTQAGLSVDEIAFARAIYGASNVLTTLSGIKGTITKGGSPVFGAAVVVEGTNGNLAGATVTQSDGTYAMSALPPGNYNVRVAPLDTNGAAEFLIRGADVAASFIGADTGFLPTGNTSVALTAGVTNTVNLTVTNGIPAFRIGYIRKATTNPGSFSIIGLPVTMLPGQSNYTIGVFSSNLPTNAASLTITGDGLTLGPPVYHPGNVFAGLNGISMTISVASNATPGLRTFIVQQGANIAYANGFLEILPTVPDYNFDGLDDLFQRKYFPLWTSTNAAPGADPDGDGYNNYAEYISGTNPTNAASLLKVQSVSMNASGTMVTWQGGPGKHYQLMSRTNVASGLWQNVGGVYVASNSLPQVLDTSATNGSRYYRVQALP